MLTTKYDRALMLTAEHHRTQTRKGRSMFTRFNAGEDGTLWYYGELAGAFASRVADAPRITWLSNELTRQLDAMRSG